MLVYRPQNYLLKLIFIHHTVFIYLYYHFIGHVNRKHLKTVIRRKTKTPKLILENDISELLTSEGSKLPVLS